MVDDRGKKGSKFEGKARDLGIMTRLDEYLTPNQPPRSKEYRQKMLDEHFPTLDGPVSPERAELTAQEATERIRDRAFELGADLVGFTELDPKYVVKDMDVAGRWAIALAFAMDFQDISTAPDEKSGIEVTRAYYVLGEITVKLAAYIRSLGYKAIAHHPRSMYGRIGAILHKPIAQKAGIGEIGRSTLLLTPEFGPRIRLATVTTELEVVPDQPIDIGLAEFCDSCDRCYKKCPTKAVPEEKRSVSPTGDPTAEPMMLWRLDFDKCLPYFLRTDGCAVCIKECTFNQPLGKAMSFTERTLKRKLKSRANPKKH